MFNIELNPRGKWKEPKKFQVVPSIAHKNRLALLYLIKNGLYVYCIDIDCGEKVSHYALKGIQDFVCSSDNGAQRILVVLTTDGFLKTGWLDNDFNIAASAKLSHDIEGPIRGVEYFFDFDTIVCSLKDDPDSKAVIKLNTYLKNNLISRCMQKFSETLPSSFVAKLAFKYVHGDSSLYFQQQWRKFIVSLQETLQNEKDNFPSLGGDTFRAVELLKEVRLNFYYITAIELVWII